MKHIYFSIIVIATFFAIVLSFPVIAIVIILGNLLNKSNDLEDKNEM